MHMFERFSTGAAALLIAAAAPSGCVSRDDARDDVRDGATAAALVSNGAALNGVSLNGVLYNGLNFNGLNFNGLNFNGLSFNSLSSNYYAEAVNASDLPLTPIPLNGVKKAGQPLPNVSLDGSTIRSVAADGTTLSGADLVGAEITAKLFNQIAITLRIDAVTSLPGAADVLRYVVSVHALGSAVPLCGLDANYLPVKAIPLSGSWNSSAGTHVDNPSVFTFACEGFALAKCVELGYAPWRTVNECQSPSECHALSLAPFHQACTRMLRADYCGDGKATTQNGTVIDTWDAFAIQTDTVPSWTFEAEWSAGGATCVAKTRWATIGNTNESVQAYIQEHCPARWQPGGCGGDGSTFFTANGYDAPLAARAVLRSRINDN